jgi:hypothetical protein
MRSALRNALAALLTAALLAACGGAYAFGSTPPALMVLDYVDNGTHERANIDAVPGDYRSPAAGKPQEKVALLPGNGIKIDQSLPDRAVKFYTGTGNTRVLVFTVQVRYYRNTSGIWIPHYLLVEQASAVPDGKGGWNPITTPDGALGPIALTGTALPNAEGYFPMLEFGLANGFLQIDSWVVK